MDVLMKMFENIFGRLGFDETAAVFEKITIVFEEIKNALAKIFGA